MYDNPILQRFVAPQHVGAMVNPNGLGVIGTPGAGDFVQMFVSMEHGLVRDVRFLTFTCPTALAACDMAAELAIGRPLCNALALTAEIVAAALGGVPAEKQWCCQLAVDALHVALASAPPGVSDEISWATAKYEQGAAPGR